MNKLLVAAFAAVVSAAAAPAARAQALPVDQIDRIVAVAEDDVILQSELDKAVGNVLSQYRSNPQQLPPREELERQVLERLILMRLQVQRAESTGIRVTDDDTDQAMQRVAEMNKIDVRTLRASLEREGIGNDEYRKSLKEQIQLQRLRQRVVQNQVNVTDSEIDILLATQLLQLTAHRRGEPQLVLVAARQHPRLRIVLPDFVRLIPRAVAPLRAAQIVDRLLKNRAALASDP